MKQQLQALIYLIQNQYREEDRFEEEREVHLEKQKKRIWRKEIHWLSN